MRYIVKLKTDRMLLAYNTIRVDHTSDNYYDIIHDVDCIL